MSLRTRLSLLISASVAIVVVLVAWTVSASARRAFATLDRQRTAALVAEFHREFEAEGDRIIARVERIAASDALVRLAGDIARSGGDYGPYVHEASGLAASYGLEFLDLVAADGTLISSEQWPARFGYRHAWMAEKDAMERSAFLHAIELPRGFDLGLFAVRTIGAGSRSLIVIGGRRLDEAFLRMLILPPGMRVLLYRNVEPELAKQQLIDVNGEVPNAAPLAPLIARVRESGRETTDTVPWPDDPQTVDGIPLIGLKGAALGVLLVASSSQELASLVQRIRWSAAAFAALGIVFGIGVSYVVAARVTVPVEQLAAAARAVADGDWDVRLETGPATGEIAELTRAFDSMTRQLVDQRERLLQAERVAAWRELARRLAHELKNPLFPLRLTVDNLRRARGLPPRDFEEVFDESLATLATGLANLNTVIARFSDFSRMPAPQFAPVRVNDLVRQSIDLFRAQAGGSQAGHAERPPINIVMDLQEDVGAVWADAEQLGRALQNLVLNAFDAMPAGGDLTVRTRGAPDSVRIDIADTGSGLTEEERHRLFTPYYTTRQHGTGLGLAIVQSVVADHHGRVAVESGSGRGTTFTISLPRERPS
jgi:signal transduction histidine kinase